MLHRRRLVTEQQADRLAPRLGVLIRTIILLSVALVAGVGTFVALRSERFEIEKAYQRLLNLPERVVAGHRFSVATTR